MEHGFSADEGFLIRKVVTGPLLTNTYVVKPQVGDTCLLIDPGDCGYEKTVYSLGCERALVVSTHGHFDHVLGVDCLPPERITGFLLSREDWPLVQTSMEFARHAWGMQLEEIRARPTGWLGDGDRVCVGNVCFQALHTPGHSPGHMTLLLVGEGKKGVAFTGDLLFKGSVGRTDLPGGSWNQLIKSLKLLLHHLGDDALILPGHGDSTTLGEEKRFNPYLRELL